MYEETAMRKSFFTIVSIISIIAVTIAGIIIGNGLYQNRELFGAIESSDYAEAKQAIEKRFSFDPCNAASNGVCPV